MSYMDPLRAAIAEKLAAWQATPAAELADEILDMLDGPIMPEVATAKVWLAAERAISSAASRGVSPGHASYHAIRGALQQMERDSK